jgi:hypothetical protein
MGTKLTPVTKKGSGGRGAKCPCPTAPLMTTHRKGTFK